MSDSIYNYIPKIFAPTTAQNMVYEYSDSYSNEAEFPEVGSYKTLTIGGQEKKVIILDDSRATNAEAEVTVTVDASSIFTNPNVVQTEIEVEVFFPHDYSSFKTSKIVSSSDSSWSGTTDLTLRMPGSFKWPRYDYYDPLDP
jgi:hypothetical protein